MQENRREYLYRFIAYCSWGFFPLYWPLLEPASADEVLAHRFVWSLAVCLVLVSAARLWSEFWSILRNWRTMLLMTSATFVIAINWGVFIWGVTHGYVVEASLGYFINPLITVAFGVVFVGERLRSLQWAALTVALFAVLILTIGSARPPWLALTLACSFATYGLIKKKADLGAVESLSVETLIAFPIALGYLGWLGTQGTLVFGHAGNTNTVLLIGTGLITAFSLLMFGAAASRIPLSSLGMLQYVGPIVQFLFGIFLFQEHMASSRWFGFILVWAALSIFTYDAIRNHRRTLGESAEATAL